MANTNIKPNTTIAELVQMMANAAVTGATCIGHNKSGWNDLFVEEYEARILELGGIVPSTEELYKMGSFNGKGAY